uniref:Peptidase S1 domain-containing protein n=1 Tax=Chelonoidis abingdonii TaxID=106734 RepID=A0A8C0G9E0_CHEAB
FPGPLLSLVYVACGFLGVGCDALILGGRRVQNHSRPYMAILESDYKEILCDGFLIQPEWVMTAAHCRSSRWVNMRVLIVLGVELLSKRSNHIWDIAKFYQHPDYDSTTLENDIMLVQVSTSFQFSPNSRKPRVIIIVKHKAACSTAGWGRTRNSNKGASGRHSQVLQEVNVTLVPRKSGFHGSCAINMRPGSHVSCLQGDSGGPLVCNGVAEGVVSFGSKECGKTPTVYTQISRYLPWINKVIKSAS